MGFGGGERLAGLLSDPAARGILGASAGLLAAGAPRTDRPVSLGEAISTGLLSGTQAFDEALAAKQRRDAAKALQDFRLERFDYLKSRDILADQLKADETAYSRSRDEILDTRYDDETAYSRGRDTILDTRYDDKTAYSRSRDAISDTRYGDETSYQRKRNEIADKREADAAESLAQLRQARLDKLTQPRRTQIAQINQDVENGYISEEIGKALIADLLKPDVLPLSPEGRVAYDRLNSPELFSSEQPVAETPEFKPADIDFRTAFGGDIAGVLTDVANIGAGAFGRAASVDRLRESAKLNNLNETLRGLLVKRSSKTGSVYSLKEVAKILPNASTSNFDGVEQYRALLPELEKMLVEAQATLNSDDKTTQTYKTQARRAVSELPGVIATIKNSLSEFDASTEQNPRGSRRNRRGTVDSSQGPITFKRVDDGTD